MTEYYFILLCFLERLDNECKLIYRAFCLVVFAAKCSY